jgi:hypothetical protein
VFRLIEASIGFHDQLRGAAVSIVKQDGNAAADSDIGRRGGLLMRDSQLHYRVFGGFSDLHRIAQPGLWEDYGELLATVSGRHVRRAAATGAQCGSYALQTRIASLVSIMIIVGFERIHIA